MNNQNISIKDIAQMAGVSVATVSRVINQNGRFSKETEERVLKIIGEYNYKPNQVARSLRVNKANVVGIIVPDITNEFFALLSLAIQQQLMKSGFAALICNTNENKEIEKSHLSILKSLQISGLIYISNQTYTHSGENIPIVYIDRRPYKSDISVSDMQIYIQSNNMDGGYLAARKLISCGCKKPAIIRYRNDISTHNYRLNGFRMAMEEACIPLRPDSIITIDKVSMYEGAAATKLLLNHSPDIDSIFYTSDILAIGGLKAIHEMGYTCPDDIQIIGFDNISIDEHTIPPLTSVKQDIQKIASLTSDVMIGCIRGEPVENTNIIIPVELIERGSTLSGSK